MPDLADLFPGFSSHWIDTSVGKIFARAGGSGPPLLLLHGYTQTNVMWHRVTPVLAKRFSLIIPRPAWVRLVGGAAGRRNSRALRQALDGEDDD